MLDPRLTSLLRPAHPPAGKRLRHAGRQRIGERLPVDRTHREEGEGLRLGRVAVEAERFERPSAIALSASARSAHQLDIVAPAAGGVAGARRAPADARSDAATDRAVELEQASPRRPRRTGPRGALARKRRGRAISAAAARNTDGRAARARIASDGVPLAARRPSAIEGLAGALQRPVVEQRVAGAGVEGDQLAVRDRHR